MTYQTVTDEAPTCKMCKEREQAAFPTLDTETGEVGVLYGGVCGILCKSFQDLRYQMHKHDRASLGPVWKAKYAGRCRVCDLPFVVMQDDITRCSYGGYAHAECEAGL